MSHYYCNLSIVFPLFQRSGSRRPPKRTRLIVQRRTRSLTVIEHFRDPRNNKGSLQRLRSQKRSKQNKIVVGAGPGCRTIRPLQVCAGPDPLFPPSSPDLVGWTDDSRDLSSPTEPLHMKQLTEGQENRNFRQSARCQSNSRSHPTTPVQKGQDTHSRTVDRVLVHPGRPLRLRPNRR